MRGTWKTENGISGKCAGHPSAGDEAVQQVWPEDLMNRAV